MAGIPFGKFDLRLDLTSEKTEKALIRIIDTRKRKWSDKVPSHRDFSGTVDSGKFEFQKTEGRSILIGLEYKGKIIDKGDKTVLSIKAFLKIPGFLLSLILMSGAIFLSLRFTWEAISGGVFAKYLLAPSLAGLAIVYFNSFFPAREEKIRTRANLRERIDNMTLADAESAFEKEGFEL